MRYIIYKFIKSNRLAHNLILYSCVCFLTLFSSASVFAQIGIISSSTSSKLYSLNHLGNYENLWSEIIYTLNFTNIKYSIIPEEKINDIDVKKYNIIILPLIQDLPLQTLQKIENYTKNKGKVIIIFADAPLNQTTQKLDELIKIKQDLPKRLESKSFVNFISNKNYSENSLPASSRIASLQSNGNSKIYATWNQIEERVPAITISETGSYIGWKWGNDGDINFNKDVMKQIIETLQPGLVKKEQTKLNFKDFSKRLDEITRILNDTYDFINDNMQSNPQLSFNEIQDYIYIAKIQENLSKAYFYDNDFEKAQEELRKARHNALVAYAKAAPSSVIEGRTLWLDRGTIVSIKSQEEMASLFDKIQKIGINMIYFETINAGYSIYPSKITDQNPMTTGKDPLLWATKEAHKRNMELHAWTWIFAVGNVKHNPLINKSYNYPGPILFKNNDLALLGSEGNLVPVNQNEYWLDPANPKSRAIILSLLEEIVKNYPVDGVQLDYIRYPFQKNTDLMGFNTETRQKFEIETGYMLDKPDENNLDAWNKWKTKQISSFVKEVSDSLRKIKPDIRISAAVFGGNRTKRTSTIQQDWEYWVNNGWIDILNPMIYSTNISQLQDDLDYFVKAVDSKAFIYPGIAVRQLDDADMLEQIYTIKNKGLVGNTLFAMAHLGSEKSEILSQGPYRYKYAKNPTINPLESAVALLDDLLSRIININKVSCNKNYSLERIINEINQLRSYIISYSSNPQVSKINKSLSMLNNIEYSINNSFSGVNGLKTVSLKSILNSLKEIETLLSYQQHKINLKDLPQNGVSTSCTVIQTAK